MWQRYLRWRNRLTSEVAVLGDQRFRITRQRGQVVGIETWTPMPNPECGTIYGYTIWRGEVRGGQ